MKEIADVDADQFISDAQTFGCKGGDFADFLDVPGLKTQKGEKLKSALVLYMGTLQNIAKDPSSKTWPAGKTAEVKGILKKKELSDDAADKFIEDAQTFGCKGGDFTDFLAMPGLNTQVGDKLKTALDVYMRVLKNIRQVQASNDAPATLYVQLPEDAKLTIDGIPTASASANRAFQTPTLDKNKEYVSTIKAEIIRDGKVLSATRQVRLRAGSSAYVTLEMPTEHTVAIGK